MMHRLVVVTAVGVSLALAVANAPSAVADDWALNGTYLATSNGDWAMTNDVYRDIGSVRSVWTIAMTCSQTIICNGTVSSDLGWTSDIVTTNGEYIVELDVPDWERCADGTGRTVTGHKRYRFFPVGFDGYLLPGSTTFAGFDKTSGESGGCSVNDKLEIDLPFRLEKLN